MPDLHGWITQQIGRAESDVRAAEKESGRAWRSQWDERSDAFRIVDGSGILVADQLQPSAAGLVTAHDPAAVLRRCVADRKILAEHCPQGSGYPSHYACEGCGHDASYCPEPITEHTNDCPTLLALAEGYGLTDEQRAQLDRPEVERPTPARHFDLVALARSTPTSSVPAALRGPNWRP